MGVVEDLRAIAWDVDVDFELIEVAVDPRLEWLSDMDWTDGKGEENLFGPPVISICPVFRKPLDHFHFGALAPVIVGNVALFLWVAGQFELLLRQVQELFVKVQCVWDGLIERMVGHGDVQSYCVLLYAKQEFCSARLLTIAT